MKLDLSPDQTVAMNRVVEAFADPASKEFRLGGLAGTGKTTLVRYILSAMQESGVDCLVCAPTAKACVALARRGVKACTIHQAIYTYLGTRVEHVGGERKVTMDFALKKEEPDGELRFDDPRRSGLVIVDESSMVNQDVADDLRARAPWILWVGDHGQLMPVGRDPGIMSRLDAKLEKIHRQAEGSAIVQVAHAVRYGEDLSAAARRFTGDAVRTAVVWNTYGLVSVADEMKADLVIVARNATRQAFNRESRLRRFGALAPKLVVGELLCGIRNNYADSIYNGETYRLEELGELRTIEGREERDVVLSSEGRAEPFRTTMWTATLGNGTVGLEDQLDSLPRYLSLLDYAYAMTCHKAQGSEAARVLVLDEKVDRSGWDPARWAYTAATRARELLVVARKESS